MSTVMTRVWQKDCACTERIATVTKRWDSDAFTSSKSGSQAIVSCHQCNTALLNRIVGQVVGLACGWWLLRLQAWMQTPGTMSRNIHVGNVGLTQIAHGMHGMHVNISIAKAMRENRNPSLH